MHKNDKPFEIIMLGPPVSGKGTQAKLLSDTFEIAHISTGQILQNIKTDKTNPLAQKVAGFMDSGNLVPTELVNELLLNRIKEDDCRFGFILDGYPRTIDQVKVVVDNIDYDYVFLIDVRDEIIIERIAGRRVCKNGHSWHLKYSPPKNEKICDICGEELFQRDDDKDDVIKERLATYHRNTDSIIKYFESRNQLIRINGEQHIDQVFQEIVRYLVRDLRNKANI